MARTSKNVEDNFLPIVGVRKTRQRPAMLTRRRPGRESAWPASGSAFITTQGDVELGKSYGLVHKLTGHGIIGGASKQTAPRIFLTKNSKLQSKHGPRFTKKS